MPDRFLFWFCSEGECDGITGADGSFLQDNSEDSLPGHDTVADLLADGTDGIPFQSGLLPAGLLQSEPGTNRELVQGDSFR